MKYDRKKFVSSALYFGRKLEKHLKGVLTDRKFKYVAIDQDGALWTYENKPIIKTRHAYRHSARGTAIRLPMSWLSAEEALIRRTWKNLVFELGEKNEDIK